MTDLAKTLRENADIHNKRGNAWSSHLERKAADEIERLTRERDNFDCMVTDYVRVIDEWIELSGCSHASAVKRELERLRAEVERLKEANRA